MFHSLSRRGIAICLSLSACSLPCLANNTEKEHSADSAEAQSPQESKKAIELFMMLTALNLIDLEWNAGYSNRIPDKDERVRSMISANLSSCPPDFREAWLKQIENPHRNYAAPVFRKYGISLASLRKQVERKLASIDSSVRPPVPLFDEEETAPAYDPRQCGAREKILEATSRLRMQLYGVDAKMAPVWKKAVERVLIEFSMNYMEAMVRLQLGELSADDVTRLFEGINVKQCPSDFRKAWRHDLPFFMKGQFGSPELSIAPTALRYGVDEVQVMKFIRKKMREWEIESPTRQSLPEFIKSMEDLKNNLLEHR